MQRYCISSFSNPNGAQMWALKSIIFQRNLKTSHTCLAPFSSNWYELKHVVHVWQCFTVGKYDCWESNRKELHYICLFLCLTVPVVYFVVLRVRLFFVHVHVFNFQVPSSNFYSFLSIRIFKLEKQCETFSYILSIFRAYFQTHSNNLALQ